MPYPVSKDQFDDLVQDALAELPERFAAFLEEVPVEVRDRPSPRQLASAGVGRGNLLLGLYTGRPLPTRSVEDPSRLPDAIYIFQSSIEAVCDSEAALKQQVRTTVLHEIGHHFGMTEGDLEALGYG